MRFAEIAIPRAVFSSFTYLVPEGVKPCVGARYEVPFGRKKLIGLCVGTASELKGDFDVSRLKELGPSLDEEPTVSAELVELMKWMATYYCSPIGEVLRAALPTRLLNAASPKTTRPKKPHEISSIEYPNIILNAPQQNALDKIFSTHQGEGHKVFLLHGVTGSGKTEVYLRLFEELAKSGKQSILLVPEINLTPQLTWRASARFKDRIAVYHSGLTDAQRHDQWQKMRRGEIDVVIGTRSALFAPLQNIGAIVIDEEHDSSFKQGEGFTYSARDCAVVRSKLEKSVCVLGSATPSLESIVNARSGKYELLELPERTGGASLPHIEIVDTRIREKKSKEKTDGQKLKREFCALTPRLYDEIQHALDAGGQVLLYVGRRGFAGQMQCQGCGNTFMCPNCDISLTVHSGKTPSHSDHLSCHYCGYKVRVPNICPDCSSDEISSLGFGTERLLAEVSDFFPEARIARLDSDTTQKNADRRKIISDLHDRKIDILIGTQMITKGHDCHSVTLVGVLSVDLTLSIPDFRSAERTFQLVTQVAGRAGRGDVGGKVIVQTRKAEHPSIITAAAHDFNAFVETELKHRKELSYPPFSRLANIRVSSPKKEMSSQAATIVAKIISEESKKLTQGKISILGPAPALIEKLRGAYRWQVLLKSPNSKLLSAVLNSARTKILSAVPSKVKVIIDVDPVGML